MHYDFVDYRREHFPMNELNTVPDNKKYSEMQTLRGVAIIAVIVIHTITEPEFNSLISSNLIALSFADVGVPMFIFISGFVLTKKYEVNFNIIGFWIKRLKRILPPYIIFATFYYFFFRVTFNPLQIDTHGHGVLVTYIFEMLTGYHHLWYIPLIIQFYFLFPFLNKFIKKKQENGMILLIIAVVITTISTIFDTSIESFINSLRLPGVAKEYLIYMNSRCFIYFIIYFVMGMFLSQNYTAFSGMMKNKKILISLWIIVIVLGILQSLIWILNSMKYSSWIDIPVGDNLPAIIMSIYMYTIFPLVLLWFCIQARIEKIRKFLFELGKYSFGIYLIHVMFTTGIGFFLGYLFNITVADWVYYPIVFFGALFISFYLTKFINKFRYHEYIIGKIE